MTLGIFFRLWSLLETACHKLDLELARRSSPLPTDANSFKQYSLLVQQLPQLNERRAELLQLTTSLNSALGDVAIENASADGHPLVKALKEEAYKAAVKLDEVVKIKT